MFIRPKDERTSCSTMVFKKSLAFLQKFWNFFSRIGLTRWLSIRKICKKFEKSFWFTEKLVFVLRIPGRFWSSQNTGEFLKFSEYRGVFCSQNTVLFLKILKYRGVFEDFVIRIPGSFWRVCYQNTGEFLKSLLSEYREDFEEFVLGIAKFTKIKNWSGCCSFSI